VGEGPKTGLIESKNMEIGREFNAGFHMNIHASTRALAGLCRPSLGMEVDICNNLQFLNGLLLNLNWVAILNYRHPHHNN